MKTFLSLVVALLLFILLIPTIISTSVGKTFLEKVILEKTKTKVEIETLSLSWLGPQKLQNVTFSNEDFNGNVALIQSSAPLWEYEKISQDFLLQKGSISFPQLSMELNNIDAKVSGQKISAQGKGTNGGSFTISGTFISETQFDCTADLKQFPSPIVDKLAEANGLFQASVGPFFNASGHLAKTGNKGFIEGNLVSDSINLILNGKINPNGIVLSDPLKLSLTWTPALKNYVKEKHQINIVRVNNPITLSIDPQGTFLPLHDKSKRKLKISNGTLNLGQFAVRDPRAASKLAIFKKEIGAPLTVWLTPINFSIEQGILTYNRFDALLSGSIHLCSWGKLNLDAQTLNLILGVPADTLQGMIPIKSISPNYVLRIPVTGPFSNPQMDVSSAKSKLGATVVSDQIGPVIGKHVPVVGRVIQKTAESVTTLQEEPGTPPPQRPFPWER